jgi:hypothetical protein
MTVVIERNRLGTDWRRFIRPAMNAVAHASAALASPVVSDSEITAEALLKSVFTRPDLGESGRAWFYKEFMEGREELTVSWGDFRMIAATARALARTAPVVAEGAAVTDLDVEWAVAQWNDQVRNRPLVNVHRRTLDSVWRQVIRYFGGDDVALIGPTHDDLLARAAQGEGTK